MRFKLYLNEAYVALAYEWNRGYSIFVNPTNKELKEIGPNQRFFVDVKNKKFYVWNDNLLHAQAAAQLKLEGIEANYPSNGLKEIWGESRSIANGKLKLQFIYSYDIIREIRKELNTIRIRDKFFKDIEFLHRWFGKSMEDEFIGELE